MAQQIPLKRREFLRRTSVGTATLAAAPFFMARAKAAPNERINIGMIGTGDRAGALLQEITRAKGAQNVQVTAVCDVWRKNREGTAARVKSGFGESPKELTRYEELLALKEVDAVVIATPDFSHGRILGAALKAGKDVYVEKPMTIDVGEANKALDLARAKSLVVQVGTQRRSEGNFLGATEFIKTGALGQINRVSGAMNVNSPRWARRFDDCRAEDVDWEAYWLGKPPHSFDARKLRCWQLFRDTTNGIPGLWMTHYADAVHMLTGAKYPKQVTALGAQLVWHDGREHGDTFHALLEYPESFIFHWSMGLGNAQGIHFTLHGTKGTLDAEKWTFTPEGAKPGEGVAKISPGKGVGHIDNWLQCLRTRERPNADIEFGHRHAVATIMSAKAAETGKRQRWDGAKREILEG